MTSAHSDIVEGWFLSSRLRKVKTISLRFAQPKRKTRELECSQVEAPHALAEVSQASPSNQQQQQAADGSLVHLKAFLESVVQTSRFDPHAAAACSEEVEDLAAAACSEEARCRGS